MVAGTTEVRNSVSRNMFNRVRMGSRSSNRPDSSGTTDQRPPSARGSSFVDRLRNMQLTTPSTTAQPRTLAGAGARGGASTGSGASTRLVSLGEGARELEALLLLVSHRTIDQGLFRAEPCGRFLWLDSNQISGTLPSQLGLLTNLAGTLDLSGNRLSGTVPTELAALEKLQGRLHLHHNALDTQAAADGGCAGKLPETCEVV